MAANRTKRRPATGNGNGCNATRGRGPAVRLANVEEWPTMPSLGVVPPIDTANLEVQADVAEVFERFCEENGYCIYRAAAACLTFFMQCNPESRRDCADTLYDFDKAMRRHGCTDAVQP